MKKVMLKLVMPFAMVGFLFASCGSGTSAEGVTTSEFKVYGNCGMCEKTIEGSLNGEDGIESADWDKDSKMMVVSYDSKTMTEDKIKEKIAAVGYDTDSHKSDDKTYASLPGCCQYDRP